ncbi:MAG: YwaF family protein [Lachnospiraceae bacterium]|nr:YwaF family protein [Lachnospiraceae bacterium]
MNGFFTYGYNLPEGSGYALYSVTHIILIVLSIVMIVGIIMFCRTGRGKSGRIARRITAIIPIVLMIMRWVFVAVSNVAFISELPLHLCSMTGMLCLLYELTSHDSFFGSVLGQALFALCLPGAVMAILFPDATYYPAWHFITVESFLFHVFITAYIIVMLIDGSIRPDIGEAYKSILFLFVIVPPVMIFDHRFGTNYMFLNGPSNGSPLTIFYESGGYGGYLVAYGLIALAVIILMNAAGFFIINLRQKKAS